QEPVSSQVGDVVKVQIKLGAGAILGGTSLTIRRVKFILDCQSSSEGINCLDDGAAVSYQGGLSSNCPVTFTSSHEVGDTLPNQVVFTPSAPLVVPAHNESYCSLEFLVRVESLSSDSTPFAIE